MPDLRAAFQGKQPHLATGARELFLRQLPVTTDPGARLLEVVSRLGGATSHATPSFTSARLREPRIQTPPGLAPTCALAHSRGIQCWPATSKRSEQPNECPNACVRLQRPWTLATTRRRGAENGRPNEQHTFQGSDAQDRRRLRAPCRVGRRTRKALGIKRPGGNSATCARPRVSTGRSARRARSPANGPKGFNHQPKILPQVKPCLGMAL